MADIPLFHRSAVTTESMGDTRAMDAAREATCAPRVWATGRSPRRREPHRPPRRRWDIARMTSRIPTLLAHRCRPVDRLHRRRRVRARRRARRRADRRRRLHRGARAAGRDRLLDRQAMVGPRVRHRGGARDGRLLLRRGGFRRLTCGHFVDNPAPPASSPSSASSRVGKGTPWCEARKRGRTGRRPCAPRAPAASTARRLGQARTASDEVPRPGQDLRRVGRRRRRLHQLPAREVHRVRRPRRRRRRQGRRRLGRVRRQPQHADRLPLPAALQGQERAATAWARTAPAPTAPTA